VVVFRDVTERQRIEKRLAQSERLASIGTMAAGTAHEINNPLAAVIANVSFVLDEMSRLEEQVPAGAFEDLRGALDDACQAAERVRRIVHDLRKFTRVETASDLSLVDLPDVIEAALKLTDNELRHHATVRRAYGTTPFVMGNEGQLTQVLTNLLVNAAQSIAPGRAEKQQIRAATFTDEGGRAVIEVTDTGSGIAKANLARIFDPFFTTKPIGAGMGLGLAISRSIILSMGGDITVDSVVGKGTTFRIALPPARQVPPPVDVPLESNLEIVRRGAVLVIDDEAAVARSIARVLSRHHEVAVESDARAAIHRIAGGELFDVIFCDLMMPNMTGIDFYGALESANPELAKRVVFMTGGAFSASSERFLESVANPVLPKPFGADSIRAIVGDYVK
jgi:nitrogen-specific signal transduction histidine kinase/CheY-like chemotaxis protein